MPENNELAKLHKERLERQERIKLGLPPVAPKQEEEQEQPFECPVCYTDGADSGLVSPSCRHKICLKCYSTVLLQKGTKANCPCCRAFYLKQEQTAPVVPANFDNFIYQENTLDRHIVYSVNEQAVNRLNQINNIMQHMIISARAHQ